MTGYGQYRVNDPFQVLVSFDINAVEIGVNPLQHVFDSTSLSFDYVIGSNALEYITYSPVFSGLILLRDDQPNPATGLTGPLIDSISFFLSDAFFTNGLVLVVRSFDLNSIKGASLPIDPFPLAKLDAALIQGADNDGNFFLGTITSVNKVPEPSGLSSIVIGLLALAAIVASKNGRRLS